MVRSAAFAKNIQDEKISIGDPIRKRIFIKYFLVIVVSAFVVISGTFHFFQRVETEGEAASGVETTRNIATQFEFNIESLAVELKDLSRNPTLLRYIENNLETDRAEVEQVFGAKAAGWPAFAQIRFLDHDGQEKIRVDQVNGNVVVVAQDALQNKQQRSYFVNSFALPENTIYVSRLDLNVERGEIEVPWKPMLRLAIPMFRQDGKRAGICIINVLPSYMLAGFRETSQKAEGGQQLSLLAADGSWLAGAPDEKLWGFMFDNKQGFVADYGVTVWKSMFDQTSGSVMHDGTLFSFATVKPNGGVEFRAEAGAPKLQLKSPELFWKIVQINHNGVVPFYANPMWWLAIIASVLVAAWIASGWSNAIAQRRVAIKREELAVARSRKVLNQTAAIIRVTDLDGRVLFVNDMFCRIAGVASDDLVDRQDTGRVSKAIDNAVDALTGGDGPANSVSGLEVDFEIGGTEKYFLLNRFALNGDDGEPDSVCIVGLDITAIKQVEKSLVEARQDALDASQAKSKFLANMSHELRTPLNAIIGYAEILDEEAEDDGLDSYREDLKRIMDAGTHLLSLINDILDLSKIEAGRMELLIEDFTLDSMLRSITSTAGPLVEKNSNKLTIECDCEETVLHSDETRLRQILLNLMSNAAKFTKDGEITLSCHLQDEAGIPTLTFKVADSGIGMTAEQLEKLFQEFSQADASITKRFQGTGLGLSISRRLAIMLGGDISVESVEGAGSTFSLKTPVRVASDSDATEVLSVSQIEQTISDAQKSETLILVIDDDTNARELLARHITSAGMQVVTADNGKDGLQRARQIKPSLITLDIKMEGMNGIEVLAQIKEDAELMHIPVVMCTISDERETCLSLGAVDFLSKPIRREQYLQTLQRHIVVNTNAPVLLVDDLPENRDLARRQLQGLGLEFIEAENGQDALNKLESVDQLQCVMLDLMMPEMDGFEFLTRFRENEKWKNVPVFVVTAKILTSEERAFLSHTAERIVDQEGETKFSDIMNDIQEQLNESLRKAS